MTTVYIPVAIFVPAIAVAGYYAWYAHRHGWKAATPWEAWMHAKLESRDMDKQYAELTRR